MAHFRLNPPKRFGRISSPVSLRQKSFQSGLEGVLTEARSMKETSQKRCKSASGTPLIAPARISAKGPQRLCKGKRVTVSGTGIQALFSPGSSSSCATTDTSRGTDAPIARKAAITPFVIS